VRESKNIIVALVGNPNSGKSTIFNILTDSNQYVGNYPGVTVEKKEGLKCFKGHNINFVDLPGTYSLSVYSDDEAVTRDFLFKEKTDIIVNVIDVANLERNLYLFTQIVELNIPVIVILNMIDILESYGKFIDKEAMSDILGVPIFATVANKKIETYEILNCISSFLENKKLLSSQKKKVIFGDTIRKEINNVKKLISKNSQLQRFQNFPLNWISIELLENNFSFLKLFQNINIDKYNILNQVKKSRRNIEEHFGKSVEMELAERRYKFANFIVKTVVKTTYKQKKINITEIIDTFILNKYLGIFIFIFMMYIIFKFTFVCSSPIINLLGVFFKWVEEVVTLLLPEGHLQFLIIDGVISGIRSVLGFCPLVLFMFFSIAFFEDCGYMVRAIFIMDKIMNRFGLPGKSFIPLMLSTNGCAVAGLFATRILDSKSDRLVTMFIVPFMICGAKLPVFALIVDTFFYTNKVTIMFLMYFLSVVIALSVAKFLSLKMIKNEIAHFVMELPPYHIPIIKNLFLKMWERSWLYIRKTGKIIFFMSIIVWIIFAYPKAPINENLSKNEQAALQMQYSFAGRICKVIEPVFKPIGMDGSRAIALIAGLAAKELILSTLGTIYAINESGSKLSLKERILKDKDWSPLKGVTFLIFCLIYTPCVASVSVFFKETGSNYKWFLLLVGGNLFFAWVISFIIFQVGSFFRIGV
jgi:ferrous iron transport protein B